MPDVVVAAVVRQPHITSTRLHLCSPYPGPSDAGITAFAAVPAVVDVVLLHCVASTLLLTFYTFDVFRNTRAAELTVSPASSLAELPKALSSQRQLLAGSGLYKQHRFCTYLADIKSRNEMMRIIIVR